MGKSRLLIVIVVVALIATFFVLDLSRFFSLEYLQSERERLLAYRGTNPVLASAIYFTTYVLITGLSLPGAAILTLLGGALFGLVWGTVLISFASTLGATLAFLIARFALGNFVRQRFGSNLEAVDKGIEKEGAFYLFTLRLVPVFPFFVVNLVMALTPIRVLVFAFVSQLGMLPGTIVYVNAGTQLAKLESLSGIVSPGLLISFVLLGLFPLIAKKLVSWFRRPSGRSRDQSSESEAKRDSPMASAPSSVPGAQETSPGLQHRTAARSEDTQT